MDNNKYRILLIEDEEHIRSMVAAILESGGYQVVFAETCESALTMFSSHLPDLIILDLGLPDRDGSHFLQKVRQNDITPIIVLSARSDEHDKVTALDMGANDYVTKPFGPAELLARVRSALRNSRHSAEEGWLPGRRFVMGDLTIDYDARQVFLQVHKISGYRRKICTLFFTFAVY